MRIGICEDDKTQREYLAAIINKHFHEKANIEMFASAEEFLFKYPTDVPGNIPFECLILDIKFDSEYMDGMELAGLIRQKDRDVNIIFVTGDRDFVFDGYKVGAVRYILKPIKPDELIEAMEYIRHEHISDAKPDYFCFNYAGDYIKLKKSDIIYIEVRDHYITMYTDKCDYTYKKTIKEILHELDDVRFVQVSRSAIINLDRVEKVTAGGCYVEMPKYLTTNTSRYIPVSRANLRQFTKRFIDYFN